LLRIPQMDCAVEESQIRRVLESFGQVRRLGFDLPARTLEVDAPEAVWSPVIAAIRKTGFTVEKLNTPPSTADTARTQRVQLMRLIAALLVAIVAELCHLMAPGAWGWQLAGMGA